MAASIAMSIKLNDFLSGKMRSMNESTKAFSKSADELNSKLRKLSEKKTELKFQTKNAQAELKKAEKGLVDFNDAAHRTAAQDAQFKLDSLKAELKAVTKEANGTQTAIAKLKAETNNPSGTSGGGGGTIGEKLKSAGTALWTQGTLQELGSSVGNALGAVAASGMTDAQANMVSSLAGGALSGAAAGSLAGPIGALAGAIVGGLAGGITAAAQEFENKDEYFKNIVQEEVQGSLTAIKDSVTSGSGTAETREQTKLAFNTMLGEGEASSFLGKLKDFGAVTPFSYDSLTDTARTLLAYGYDKDEIIPSLTKIGDAAAAMGMSDEDRTYVAKSLGRMKTTDKANLEYLNPLLERGVDVYGYLSKAYGMGKDELSDALSKGKLSGSDVADVVLNAMGKEYAGMMDEQSQTYGGLKNTLDDLKTDLDAAAGEGYNEYMKSSMKNDIAFYSGEKGEDMKEAYTMLGQYQAELDGAQEMYKRKALTSMVDSDEYKAAKAAGDTEKMTELVALAQSQAQNDYYASELYQNNMNMEERLLTATREDVGRIYGTVVSMYSLQQEYTKGYGATDVSKGINESTGVVGGTTKTVGGTNYTYNAQTGEWIDGRGNVLPPGFSTGLGRVPYDGYRAILHEGERVVTASKAQESERKERRTFGDIHIHVGSVNGDNVTEIVREMAAQFERALAQYGG